MTEKDALWVTHRNAPLFNRAECTHYEKSLILAMAMKSLGLFDVIWASLLKFFNKHPTPHTHLVCAITTTGARKRFQQ